MNNLRMSDTEIRAFVKEYLYRESSYSNIIIYPLSGLIRIEYVDDDNPKNDNTLIIDTHDSWNYPTLYAKVNEEFTKFITELRSSGIEINIDANKLVRFKRDFDAYIKTKNAIKEFRNRLIRITSEFNRIPDGTIVVSEKADRVIVTYKDEKYILSVPDYNEIQNVQRHDGILEITKNYLTELIPIILSR